MGTCRECRFGELGYAALGEIGYLACRNPHFKRGYPDMMNIEKSAKALHFECDTNSTWKFVVGPDFGCIHWEGT